MIDITVWRTHHGAEFDSIQRIPCMTIANGELVDSDGDTIGDDHPELIAEIKRRGRAVYRDHGYGDGYAGVPVAGCDHTEHVMDEPTCTYIDPALVDESDWACSSDATPGELYCPAHAAASA